MIPDDLEPYRELFRARRAPTVGQRAMNATAPIASAAAAWSASLRLGFTRVGDATRLVEREHRGPLRVQKALYPEGEGVCQAIVLHPPSGIAGGDVLHIVAHVGAHAHAQITTPGAGKWYRSGGRPAAQSIDFSLAGGATLEWLPQETIIFDGAEGRLQTSIELAADSRYIGWEILCLGRRAAGERYGHGQLGLSTRVERCGVPLWLERGQLAGGDVMLHSAAGWAGASVGATLIATLAPGDEPAPLLAACRELAPVDGAQHALTALPGLLVARYLGDSSEAARHWFTRLWQTLRPALLGRAALPPRIWAT